MAEQLEELAPLWLTKNKDKRGKKMYSGKTKIAVPPGATLLLLLVDKGDNDKRPDLRIVVLPEDGQGQAPPKDEFEGDDVPF